MQNTTSDRTRWDRFEERPTVGLTHAFDEVEDPTEVTVFPETSPDVTTTWITIDVDHVVDLGDAV